ncbi:hypothetical protein CAAN1_20S02586 [[Candida] anglica]|uniref:Aminotransferase class I/classII large domain-containing protein n=1 Tax=[Candida] anglica TaxID=148631 RepID=A0ABP0EFK5_9ASCO
MTSPYGNSSPTPNDSRSGENLEEFERLESTLPPPLRRSASSLLEALSLGGNTPVDSGSSTPIAQHENRFSSSWLNSRDSVPSSAHVPSHGAKAIPAHVLSDHRSTSPIPMPKPKFNSEILKPAMNTKQSSTGVLWVTERASEYGFDPQDADWANLGQGAPEHGDTVPGSFKRPTSIPITNIGKEYAPTAGIKELREAVANYYNDTYRQGKPSKYSYKNVCIVPGGRAGLTRIASIISDCYLSFFLPDYTAYAEMLSLFKNFSPIPVPLNESDNYEVHLEYVKRELDRGVSALLTSNPRNPTGRCMTRRQLAQLHDLCRQKCLLIMDEFYSHYYYDEGCNGSSISSAEFVEDVNRDPVLILNGLTKAFRLPGWRICWILGPEEYINALSSAGSFLDGGSNAPLQYTAVDFLEPVRVRNEMKALQQHFKMKRDYVVGRLSKMGFKFTPGPHGNIPNSTFYLWLNLSHLPGKLSNCLGFFHECLHEKVIIVPGFFFLINPQNLSKLEDVIWYHYVRISYGPEFEQIVKGMDGIERILERYNCLPYKRH